MLTVSGLNVFHGNMQVVWDLSFHVNKGELVTMIGPNGAGKTTTVETIVGLNRKATGSILFDGENVLGSHPYHLFKKGLALVPEKREIFPSMPVIENLRLGGTGNPDPDKTLAHIYRLFPGSAGTAISDGRYAFRRRTADACHWPCPYVGTPASHS